MLWRRPKPADAKLARPAFLLLGRDFCGRFIKPVFCACWASPGYAAVFVQHYGRQPAAVPAVRRCRRADCRTCFLRHAGYHPARSARDEPGYWWHTYRMAWKQNWRESLCPVPGRGFALGCGGLFCCTPCLIWKTCLSRYGSAWCLASSFCWCSACICLRRWFWSACPRRAAEKRRAVHDRILPHLAAGAVLCICWGVCLPGCPTPSRWC